MISFATIELSLLNLTKEKNDFYAFGIYWNACDLQFPNDDFCAKQWVKIVEIDDVIRHGELKVEIAWNENHLQIHVPTVFNLNVTDICYRINKTSNIYFTSAKNCTMRNGTKVYYHFKYVHPNARYFSGDIQYNTRIAAIDSCNNVSSELVPDLRYFKSYVVNNVLRRLHGPLYDFGSKYRFYSERDFINLEAQLRENLTCFNVGSMSPHLNHDISVFCSNYSSIN